TKKREFLGGGARLDRERARGHSIALVAAEKAKIAGAQKGDDLVEDLGTVQWVMQTKTGEAEIDRQGLVDLGAAVIEKVGSIGNGCWNAVAQRVDGYRTPVEMSEVKQLQPELASVGGEKTFVRTKS